MDTAPYRWTAEITESGLQPQPLSFSISSGAAPIQFSIEAADWRRCIQHVMGYSEVLGSANAWTLSRKLPAKHPDLINMRATRITSLVGLGPGVSIPIGTNGRWGEYQKYRVTVLFEQPPYPILDDIGASTAGEYNRFVTKSYKTNVETISRKGEPWYFMNAAAKAVTAPSFSFQGELLEKVPKGILEWKWHNVPEKWLMLGGLYPSNLRRAVGTVNLRDFPVYSQNDHNTGLPIRFPPGTLLFLPPEITPASQWTPQMLQLSGYAQLFPRVFDVTLRWLDFDPPTDDTTTVSVGGNLITVRGHNLVPLPKPTNTGYRWYAAAKKDSAGTAPTSPLVSDSQLLYQYFDHEYIFQYARKW